MKDSSIKRWLPNPPKESDMVEFSKLSLHLLASERAVTIEELWSVAMY